MIPNVVLCDFWNVVLLPDYQGELLNDDLIKFFSTHLPQTKKYILTSSPKVILEQFRKVLVPPFQSRMFTTQELGLSKSDSKLYSQICSLLQIKPETVLLIDDSKNKIQAAHTAGLHTHLYTTNQELFSLFNSDHDHSRL